MDFQNLRVLSQIFSPSTFQKIVREDDFTQFNKQTGKYINIATFHNNLALIKYLYKTLQNNYRCEYIYKNNLFLQIFKKEKLEKTLILNELKIGSSKADLVLLNGSVRVYEIKTELDSLGKLSKQLDDYQKFADKIYVVTDDKFVEKLKAEYLNSNIGIILLDSDNKLVTIKEASANDSRFDFDTIFKILRKQEYLDLVFKNFGFIPEVPNTKMFRVCYDLLRSINLVDFQRQVLFIIKERKLLNSELLQSSKTPKELKHICNCLDFNEQEYFKLYKFLSSSNLCINHI